MAINFGLGGPGIDAMQILQSYGAGKQTALQDGARTSLSELVRHPDDQGALYRYGQYDPENAFKIGQDQRAAQAKRMEISDDELSKAAAQVAGTAKDEAHFEGAINYYVEHGFPQAAKYRGQWANREAIMAQGGFQPRPEVEPALQREYEYIKQVAPDQAEAWLKNKLNPTQWVPVTQGDGSVTLMPVPKSPGGAIPAIPGGPAPQGGSAPPPGFIVNQKGGAAPVAQGGFPR